MLQFLELRRELVHDHETGGLLFLVSCPETGRGPEYPTKTTDSTVTISNTINGNAADNELNAKGGVDTVNARAGDDRISVLDFAGGDKVDCGEGSDTVFFDAGDTGPNPLTQPQPINCERNNPP